MTALGFPRGAFDRDACGELLRLPPTPCCILAAEVPTAFRMSARAESDPPQALLTPSPQLPSLRKAMAAAAVACVVRTPTGGGGKDSLLPLLLAVCGTSKPGGDDLALDMPSIARGVVLSGTPAATSPLRAEPMWPVLHISPPKGKFCKLPARAVKQAPPAAKPG
mmetsp:Transcript_132999/g.242188  ORF Transcript_132999/g.242188 Transcript_132999/m.242188 type:complete len:165 (-) Transcript_132999:1495-1989(-)